MSLGVAIGIGAAITIAIFIFVPQTGADKFFSTHPWVLPFIAFALVLVVLVEVQGFSGSIHRQAIEGCERRNPEVVSEVKNLESDRASLRNNRNLLKALNPKGAPLPVPVVHYIAGETKAIEGKSEAIGEKVTARAQFSEHPGGDPRAAVVVDCHAAYPGH